MKYQIPIPNSQLCLFAIPNVKGDIIKMGLQKPEARVYIIIRIPEKYPYQNISETVQKAGQIPQVQPVPR